MLITIISCVFPPEPIVSAQMSGSLSDYLCKSGHDVSVVKPPPSRCSGLNLTDELSFPYPVYQVNSFVHPSYSVVGRFRESFSFGWKCARHILRRRHEIEAVYINSWPLFGQLLPAIMAKLLKKRVVMQVMDIYPESLTSKVSNSTLKSIMYFILLPIDQFTLWLSDEIVVISVEMKDYMASHRRGIFSKLNVIAVCQPDMEAELAVARQKNSTANATPAFMYLGNIGPASGLNLIVGCFLNSLSRLPFYIMGQGTLKDTLIEISGNDSRISFGDVPAGKVFETQSKADILILPISGLSSSFSVPSKLVAYMFSAKPILVISEPITSVARIVKEAECGWVVDITDEKQIIDFFSAVTGEWLIKENIFEMGQNGFKYAERHFSSNRIINELASLISDGV